MGPNGPDEIAWYLHMGPQESVWDSMEPSATVMDRVGPMESNEIECEPMRPNGNVPHGNKWGRMGSYGFEPV